MNRKGFSLVEMMVVVAIVGLITVAINQTVLRSNAEMSKITAKSNLIQLIQLIAHRVNDVDLCSTKIGNVAFNLAQAQNQDIDNGMPINFDFTAETLGNLQDGTDIAAYNARIDLFRLVSATDPGITDSNTNSSFYNVTLMVRTSSINNTNVLASLQRRLATFTVEVDSGGNITSCQSATFPLIQRCAVKSFPSGNGGVYHPYPFDSANGSGSPFSTSNPPGIVNPDAEGCIPIEAFRGAPQGPPQPTPVPIPTPTPTPVPIPIPTPVPVPTPPCSYMCTTPPNPNYSDKAVKSDLKNYNDTVKTVEMKNYDLIFKAINTIKQQNRKILELKDRLSLLEKNKDPAINEKTN